MARGLELDIGMAGLGLLRNWLVGDPATAEAILTEAKALLNGARPEREEETAVPEFEVGDAYAEWAPSYDSQDNPIFAAEEPAMAALLDGIPPGQALDAACGTGRQSAILRQLGHSVVGIDSSPAMLRLAKAKVPDADFRLGRLDQLPAPDAAFDLAVCSLALTHLPDIRGAVAELARVVRPGGQIVISDIHPMFVALSAQAGFRNRAGAPSFTKNYVHLVSSYFAAFQAASLTVEAMTEATYGPAQVELEARRSGNSPLLMATALNGLPAVLLWRVRRR